MGAQAKRLAGTILALLPSSIIWAQLLGAGAPEPASPPELGGKTTIDLVMVDAEGAPLPLKHGGIVPNSEVVEVDGRRLELGADYTLDYAGGVLYLFRSVSVGRSVRVMYRFDTARAKAPTLGPAMSPQNTLALGFGPGTGFQFGFALAERSAGGSLFRSNVVAFNNATGIAPGLGLKGIAVVSERRRMNSLSLYEPMEEHETGESRRSQAIVQSLSGSFLGAKIEGSLQDIREDFTAFDSFRAAGFAEDRVGQLVKERGLKRTHLDISDLGAGALKLHHGYREVTDEDGRIEWRSMGFDAGPLALQFSRRWVDPEFKRFGDIAEADREWLAKERGLNRETLGMKFATGAVGLQADALKVEDGEGAGVYRRTLAGALGPLQLAMSDQHVESTFSRFGDLRESDAGQLAREQGLRRQNLSLGWKPGEAPASVSYARGVLRTDDGDFASDDVAVAGNGWSLRRSARRSDKGFARMGSMTEPEVQGHLRAIGQMYGLDDAKPNGNDRNAFLGAPGLERDAISGNANLAGVGLAFGRTSISGAEDGATVDRFAWWTRGIEFSYRDQRVGDAFAEQRRLMPLELGQLSNIVGLDRRDWSFEADMGRGRAFAIGSMRAVAPEGEAERSTLAYRDGSLDFRWGRRDVDATFHSVGNLVDPEKDLLSNLRGFAESSLAVKWQPMRSLKLDLDWRDARSEEFDQTRMFRQTAMTWVPDKATEIGIRQHRYRNDDPTNLLVGTRIDLWSLTRDFGRAGKLEMFREERELNGQMGEAPDSVTDALVYTAKLGAKTDLRTEQVRTRFENGEHENIRSNTLSTEITPRTGVSVTETNVDRDGDRKDETKRDYGMWLDFGKGIRLNYGYVRHLREEANGELQSGVSVSPGEFQGVKIEQARYNTQRWDNQRQRSQGAVQLASARPFTLGFLRDAAFDFNVATQRDRDRWEQEHHRFGLSGKVLGAGLSWQYRSVVNPQGDRAIDRGYGLTTDPNGDARFSASLAYKMRTLPDNRSFAIRNYTITARPGPGWELSHQFATNPEVVDGNQLLGSMPQATSASKWRLYYAHGKRQEFGVAWDELINDHTRTVSRVGGLSYTLCADDQGTSPLQLFYGIEESDFGGSRRHLHRYHLRFDQRPGPNQTLSIFAGNVSYILGKADGETTQNWTVRMEYQLRL